MANMLYNGVEQPDIESVWTDKVTYPNAVLLVPSDGVGTLVLSQSQVQFESAQFENNPAFTVLSDGDFCFYYVALTEEAVSLLASAGITATVGEYVYGGEATSSAGTTKQLGGLPFWSNYDILNTDGSVYLAASTPVPVSTLTPAEFLRWFSLGQAVRRGAVKEATMYSYNGVVLPKLPEWDRVTYPYAYILTYGDDNPNIRLVVRKTKATVNSGGSIIHYQASYGSSFLAYTSRDGSAWAENTTTITITTTRVLWGSVDVYYSESVENVGGTLYLAGSDPIPVYE